MIRRFFTRLAWWLRPGIAPEARHAPSVRYLPGPDDPVRLTYVAPDRETTDVTDLAPSDGVEPPVGSTVTYGWAFRLPGPGAEWVEPTTWHPAGTVPSFATAAGVEVALRRRWHWVAPTEDGSAA
jgi:hypothetical protein